MSLGRAAEALETTERYRNRERPVPISSESPSARAARDASGPPYLNGSTAIQRLSSVRTGADSEPEGALASDRDGGTDAADNVSALSSFNSLYTSREVW